MSVNAILDVYKWRGKWYAFWSSVDAPPNRYGNYFMYSYFRWWAIKKATMQIQAHRDEIKKKKQDQLEKERTFERVTVDLNGD